MPTETPLPPTDPIMIAWEKWKETPEYANARKWAADPEHVDGSLWRSFLEGYGSNRADAPGQLKLVSAGVGDGHPHDSCDRCGAKKVDEDDELIATCTATEYVTPCRDCYAAAGNSVR